MARAYGSRAELLLAYESTYGTAPASGFRRLPFASTTLGRDQGLIENELLGYGRDPLAPSRDVINVDGDVVIPVDADGIGYWLKGLLGNPVTTGTTPKVHTFQSGAVTLPSMAIEKNMPDLPRFEMFSGLRANSMSFTMQRSGNLQATVSLIGRGMVPAATTQAGSPTDITLARFNQFQGSILRDSVALGNIVSADFTYTNNLDRVETIRADGQLEDAEPTIAGLTGTITARLADETLLAQALSGAPCALQFGWTLSASQSLIITAHAVYLPHPRTSIPGPNGLQVEFAWQAAKAASPARMMTAVLTNSVASY
jgi:hypothetical protein